MLRIARVGLWHLRRAAGDGIATLRVLVVLVLPECTFRFQLHDGGEGYVIWWEMSSPYPRGVKMWYNCIASAQHGAGREQGKGELGIR